MTAWIILRDLTFLFLFASLINAVTRFFILFSDSVGQSTSQLVKEPCTVSDLHPLLRQRICQRLDIKHSTGEGYRKLAAYFDMTSNDIITISQNPNPTDNVLRWVGYKPKNTIAKLRDVLQTMGREDCVKVIDEGRPLGKCYVMVKLQYKFRNYVLSSRRKPCSNHLAAYMYMHLLGKVKAKISG